MSFENSPLMDFKMNRISYYEVDLRRSKPSSEHAADSTQLLYGDPALVRQRGEIAPANTSEWLSVKAASRRVVRTEARQALSGGAS